MRVGLVVRSGLDVALLVQVGLFQLPTSLVGGHMVGRAADRTGQFAECHLVVDETDEDGAA